jgi:hypothetical protein
MEMRDNNDLQLKSTTTHSEKAAEEKATAKSNSFL